MTPGQEERPLGIRPLLVGSAVVVLVLVLLGAGVIALGALQGNETNREQATASSEDFPAFVYKSPEVLAGYRFAVQQPELLASLPCYCGCVGLSEDPHRNLADCFLNEDGSYDAHASNCAICLDIAREAARWSVEGRSPAEIRSLVEGKYGDIGPSTDDPLR